MRNSRVASRRHSHFRCKVRKYTHAYVFTHVGCNVKRVLQFHTVSTGQRCRNAIDFQIKLHSDYYIHERQTVKEKNILRETFISLPCKRRTQQVFPLRNLKIHIAQRMRRVKMLAIFQCSNY